MLSAKNKIILQQAIAKDPIFLIREILHYDKVDEDHREIVDFLIKSDDEALIRIPRGCLKTSVVTIGLTIWCILQNRDIRININNKILANARKFLAEIKEHFERNADLIEIYGNMKGDVWQTDQIKVAGRQIIRKDPTIQIGALGHEATSAHFDLIINDDLVGLIDRLSEAGRNATLNFYKAVQYLRDPFARTKIWNVGTNWHIEDLYFYIEKRLEKGRSYLRRALSDDGRSLFPKIWRVKDLLKMREDDIEMFSAQMQNDPMPAGTQLFKFDELGFFDLETFEVKKYALVNYTDFAMSKRTTADFTANITVAYDRDYAFVLDAYIERVLPADFKAVYKQIINRWNLYDLGAESNGVQDMFIDDLVKETGRDIRKIQHHQDKVLRITSIHSLIRSKVKFRKDWEIAYPRLIEQLIRFSSTVKHDDGPDALEGALSMIYKDNKIIDLRNSGSQALKDERPMDIVRRMRAERYAKSKNQLTK